MNSWKPFLKLLRPTQWIKNGFVFMPLVFSGKLFVQQEFTSVTAMCLAFCLTSSAAYILNDYMDMEQDKAHPLKRTRPLASGQISPRIGSDSYDCAPCGSGASCKHDQITAACIRLSCRIHCSPGSLFTCAKASGDS